MGRMLENIPPGGLSKAHVQMSGLGWDHFKMTFTTPHPVPHVTPLISYMAKGK